MINISKGGSFLRNARLQADLTIEDVAKRSGLDISDISRMERGRISSPSLDKTITYGRTLGLTPNQVAAAYGLWFGADGGEDQRILRLCEQVRSLPDAQKNQLVDMVETLLAHSEVFKS